MSIVSCNDSASLPGQQDMAILLDLSDFAGKGHTTNYFKNNNRKFILAFVSIASITCALINIL